LGLEPKMDRVIDVECPILKETMTDPVIAEDGFTYERSAIETWFSRRKDPISPMTGNPISKTLIPNLLVRKYIDSLDVLSEETKRKRVNTATVLPKRVRVVDVDTSDDDDTSDEDEALQSAVRLFNRPRMGTRLFSPAGEEHLPSPSTPVGRMTFVLPRSQSNAAQGEAPFPVTPENQGIRSLGYTYERIPGAPTRYPGRIEVTHLVLL
jgi:hypothetical protein